MSKTFEALEKAEKEKAEKNKSFNTLTDKPRLKKKDEVPIKVRTWVTEEYKRMKQLFVSDEYKTKSIVFASSKPQEGTSTVLYNFASELAKGGDKVILVDANLRTPVIHSYVKVDQNNGFRELLFNKKSLDEVIKKTNFKNMNVITCGASGSDPFIGLSPDVLPELIKKLGSKADWILFDAPPIHSFNDVCTLAEELDGIVLVVEAEKTKWEVAQSAKDRIERNNIRILGAILNKRRMHIPNWLYKYI